MAVGRPTKLTDELIKQAENYLTTWKTVDQEAIPTIEGLAIRLGISRDTVYEWRKVPVPTEGAIPESKSLELHLQFSDIVNELQAKQARTLISNGLNGKFNPTITKLILSGKHNYVEKTESDLHHSGEVQFLNGVPRPGDE